MTNKDNANLGDEEKQERIEALALLILLATAKDEIQKNPQTLEDVLEHLDKL